MSLSFYTYDPVHQRVCSRAAFQFKPELEYEDETSSSNTEFDLGKWKEGFAQSKLSRAMYFV